MKYDLWEIKNRYPDDPIGAILDSRHIADRENFFNPKYQDLPTCEDFPGLLKAKEIIVQAISDKKKIGIFGDYDADGICGAAILYKAINRKDLVEYYIPDRSEGYGLTNEAVDKLKKRGVSLLITVDCGIKNNAEIEYAKSQGIGSIIVDHHQLGKALPQALAIVHPLIKSENRLKFKEFSGGGVAYMLGRELMGGKGKEKWLIDLAAISTISDIVPLVDSNRIIVKFGLLVLNKTKNIGLKSLCEAAEIQMGKIGGYEVGYMIAPRLNAAGRVSIPIKGLELLISEDPNESNAIAQTLNKLNVQRQKLMDEATKDAISQIENEKMYQKNILILKNENWNEGVVGLVAGRIAQKYFRPTIILTQKGKKLKGSARSIPGVDITAALSGAGELLLSYGGHNQAAGLSLREADFSKFCKIMVSLANKIPEKLFSKKLRIDCLISIEKINKSFADKLDKMEPFGNGNPRPIFAFEDVEILQARTMGKDNNHYRLTVGRESRSSECIAFNADKDGWAFKRGQKIDVAFSVKASQWQGVEKIDLIIEDVKEKR